MELIEFLRTHRTYRRFQQTPVPQAVMDNILEAARLSSCGHNRQALRYIAVQSPEMVSKVLPWVHWAAALPPEQGQPKADEVPTAFIAVLQDSSVPGFSDVDTGLAMANMTTAAWLQGVGSCMMGAINRPVLTEVLAVPAEMKLLYLIALGYPSHQSHIVEVENGSLKYYLDEERNYCVPKHSMEKILLKTL